MSDKTATALRDAIMAAWEAMGDETERALRESVMAAGEPVRRDHDGRRYWPDPVESYRCALIDHAEVMLATLGTHSLPPALRDACRAMYDVRGDAH